MNARDRRASNVQTTGADIKDLVQDAGGVSRPGAVASTTLYFILWLKVWGRSCGG